MQHGEFGWNDPVAHQVDSNNVQTGLRTLAVRSLKNCEATSAIWGDMGELTLW
jgi:hypothetical protein